MQGASIFIRDGFAEVELLDPATRGVLVGRLLDAAKAEGLKVTVDTGGVRKRYIVPEYIAAAAGFLVPEDDAPPLPPIPAPVTAPVEVAPEIVEPPRPGHKGATKAAWLAFALAQGLNVSDRSSLSAIVSAWDERLKG